MSFRLRFVPLALMLALVVAACTPVPPPLPDPVIDPAGPVEAPVGTSVAFTVENIAGDVEWSVDDVLGGAAVTGTIDDGVYEAPARVPYGRNVTVTAADAADPSRQASAEVTVTAPGTLYVFDETVHVYGDLDTVDGNVAPDRSFTLAGVAGDIYDMAMAPALDVAFISLQIPAPSVYRVEGISTAEGEVTAVGFSSLAYEDPSGLAYDEERDVLYVVLENALLAYDGASTAPEGQEPTRVIAGAGLDALLSFDVRLNLDAAADRLFVSNPEGMVGVYEAASTIDGEAQPDRLITLDADFAYLWGAAYDVSRDELYLGDQKAGVGVYVIADASTADGLVAPDRSIGGLENPFTGPSELGYDAANDRLMVVDADAGDVKVFDAASTVDGDVAPTRVIGGDQLPLDYPYGGYLDPTM